MSSRSTIMLLLGLLCLSACKDPARDETRSLVDAVTRFRLAGDFTPESARRGWAK